MHDAGQLVQDLESSLDADESPSATPTREEDIATGPFSLILDDILVDHVFQFVGGGHYRYLAGTNSKFRRLYNRFL